MTRQKSHRTSTFSKYVTAATDYIDPPERSMAALHDDENDESRIERGLDICRKVLIALLVFLGMLYYVTYEYDGAFYEGSSGTAKIDVDEYWFGGWGSDKNARPAIVAPDPFELPLPNEFEESAHHLPRAYVIGSPRCGCEVLRSYMKFHPQIFFSNHSQVHYWDKHPNFDLEWYKSQIPATKSWQVAVDFTSDYFTAAHVPERIDGKLGNHTRIILMVCDPIERARLEFAEIRNGNDNFHNEWRQKMEAVDVTDFANYAQLYMKYLAAVMSNPTQIEGIDNYEDFVDNIATIRPEAAILTTGLYDIHIRRWLKNFDRGNMLIMDGRTLQTSPIVAVRRIQNFLRVSDSIPSKAFAFNATAGLFCLHLKYVNNEDRIVCPERSSFLLPANTDKLDASSLEQLKSFFAPHMAAFAHMSNETFQWAFIPHSPHV